jgi:ADP-heptose:LPS heptosyltransferase
MMGGKSTEHGARVAMNMTLDRIEKILIIKLGGLGDVFLSTVIVESLLAQFPNANIDYFVEIAGRAAIDQDPRIHSIFTLDKRRTNPVSVIAHVRSQRYDMVIDLFGNPRSAIITLTSGARYRVGLDYGWRKHLYSIVGTAQRDRLHGAEVNLQVLPALGIVPSQASLHFYRTEGDLRFAKELWEINSLEGKFVIGILPTGSWSSKRCEPAKFAEIISECSRRFHATSLVVWGPTDEKDARQIYRLAGGNVLLGPRATLRENVSLLARCNAIIANDSGPMHLASALDVPILCIYGPTFPEGPFGERHAWVRNEGLDCLVCNLLECPIQHQCMTELSVARVVEAFEGMLRKNNLVRPGWSK